MIPIPAVRESNREVLAERLHWPDGSVDVCRDLEIGHPAWMVWFNTGGIPLCPCPVYTACLRIVWVPPALWLKAPDPYLLEGSITTAELAGLHLPPRNKARERR